MRENSAPEGATNSITAEARGERIIFTSFKGKPGWNEAESAWLSFQKTVGRMERPVWISDTLQMTGFDPTTLVSGARWFTLFRERGGTHCLVISRWDRAIMAARTMALGLGVRIRNYSSYDEALAAAAELLDAKPLP